MVSIIATFTTCKLVFVLLYELLPLLMHTLTQVLRLPVLLLNYLIFLLLLMLMLILMVSVALTGMLCSVFCKAGSTILSIVSVYPILSNFIVSYQIGILLILNIFVFISVVLSDIFFVLTPTFIDPVMESFSNVVRVLSADKRASSLTSSSWPFSNQTTSQSPFGDSHHALSNQN